MMHAPSRLSSLPNGMEFLSSFYENRLVPGQWQMVLRLWFRCLGSEYDRRWLFYQLYWRMDSIMKEAIAKETIAFFVKI